jgi:ABC-type polysaccharide/polyol phosphate export permease
MIKLATWRYYIDFVLLLTKKEIQSRYKRTLLGFLWVILNPLLQMLIIGLVFQFFVPMKIENYFLFLFAGLLPWSFFTNSLLRTTTILVQERSLIQKAAFPRELLVVSAVLANLFHTLIASSVFLLFLVFLQSSLLAGIYFLFSRIFLFVIFFIIFLFFVLASCLIVSAEYVKFRDLNFIVQLAVQLLFYAVPVIYSLDMLPEFFRRILYWNPLVSFIEVFRAITLGMNFDIKTAILVALLSFIFLLLSLLIFKKESKNFDDWF